MPWALPTTEAELLGLAKSYPFEAPGRSYLFRDGEAEPISGRLPGAHYAGRIPIIAHGSNRAPDQLRRKFGSNAEIPVSRAWLADYDVVYSAHVTQYGSIAANLQHAPGARVEVFVTWLCEVQLARMHETELGHERYHYGRMVAVELTLETGPRPRLTEAMVYLSTQGCLAEGDGPVGLAAVAAEHRPHGALHQEEALDLVRTRHRPAASLDQHILTTIRDVSARHALIEDMRAHSLPAAAPHFAPLKA